MTHVDGTQPYIRIRGIQIDRILPVRPTVCSFNSLFFFGLYFVFVLANQNIQTTQTWGMFECGTLPRTKTTSETRYSKNNFHKQQPTLTVKLWPSNSTNSFFSTCWDEKLLIGIILRWAMSISHLHFLHKSRYCKRSHDFQVKSHDFSLYSWVCVLCV